jgi:hypothetical protein
MRPRTADSITKAVAAPIATLELLIDLNFTPLAKGTVLFRSQRKLSVLE